MSVKKHKTLKEISEGSIAQLIYPLAFITILIRLVTRLIQQIKHLHFDHFQNSYLWNALIGVFLFHLTLFFLASSSQKLKLSGPVLYLGFLLTFYFSVLLNHCSIHLPDIIILIIVLIVGIFFITPRISTFKWPQWQWENILIVLWLTHSLLFFLEYNFDIHRTMYQDEWSFWYVAAENMINKGTLAAQMSGYPGGGLHPFGIPFITSLPLLFLKIIPLAGLYFMPVIILLMTCVFLCRIKKNPWVFLFFLTALFCTFNNRSWMATLFYQLVYGEGLSTIIFLWFTYEMVNNNSTHTNRFLLSFLIGLLALTKSPLTLTFLLFLLVFFIKNRGQISWKPSLICLILAMLPSVIWKIFIIKYHIGYNKPSFDLFEMFSRLPKPNVHFVLLSIQNMYKDAQNFVYFGILSSVFWAFFSKRIVEGIPMAFLLIGICFYYSYYYAYGSIGDYGSFLRYVMPASLALYYLGAIGFNALWERLESSKIHFLPKMIIGISLVGLLIHKLF